MALVDSRCSVCGIKVEILDYVLEAAKSIGQGAVCYDHRKFFNHKELDRVLERRADSSSD